MPPFNNINLPPTKLKAVLIFAKHGGSFELSNNFTPFSRAFKRQYIINWKVDNAVIN